MDGDLEAVRSDCQSWLRRLDGSPSWESLKSAHMDVALFIGQIQGAVNSRRRQRGESDALCEAESALERLKAGSRKVGADIRLANESTLAMGLRIALNDALEAIDALGR